MKLINGILGCALATGLMICAPFQSHAVIIDDALFPELKLKLVLTYQDGSKSKQVAVTSKEILKELGYPNAVLVYQADKEVGPGASPWEDIYVVDTRTKEILANLTDSDVMRVHFQFETFTDHSKGDKISNKTVGTFHMEFDSHGNLGSKAATDALPLAGYSYFDISGWYIAKHQVGKFDKNDNRKVNEAVLAKNLSGTGFDTDLNGENEISVTADMSAKGSGKILF